MRNEFTHYILLGKRLLLSLMIFLICKVVFLIYNYHYFSAYSGLAIASTFFYGLRFDISTVLYLNIIIFFLHILPFNFRNNPGYQKLLTIFFVIFNSVALIFEVVEVVNFNAVSIRFDHEIFGVAGDVADQFGSYLRTFWYVVIIGVLLIYGMAKIYNYFTKIKETTFQTTKTQVLLMLAALPVFFIGARGGLQERPISLVNSMEYTNAVLSPLVYNTCFSIGTSYVDRFIEERHFFQDEKELHSYFDQKRCYYNDTLPQKKMNVVVIALESFSRYFVQSLSNEPEKCTPFLDSLINSESAYVAVNGYANARHSHEGNAAILASIPMLMMDPFMTSEYQEDSINSFVKILRNHGYQTAYFHAAKNGSLRLDELAYECGVDHYFGLNEYPDKNDYDGNWGIFDHKFFPFAANKFNTFQQPFVATIFNLSSHFPFTMPAEFKDRFKCEKVDDPEIPMIKYTDYTLQQFFAKIKNEPWYNNTLFVMCADHTYHELSEHPTDLTKFSIPILFYCPSDTGKKAPITFPVQHVDIMPSILHYLNVPDSFRCFGNSIFAPDAPHYAFNYEKGLFQLVEQDAVLQFNGYEAIGFYDLKKDPFMIKNLLRTDDPRIPLLNKRMKAVIQTYNSALIHNELY